MKYIVLTDNLTVGELHSDLQEQDITGKVFEISLHDENGMKITVTEKVIEILDKIEY